MGLLDELIKYIKDASPGGLLNPELTPDNVRTAAEFAAFEPGLLGSVASVGLAADDVRKGNYGDAALNGLGLLPFVPAMGGMIRNPVGRIPETGKETRELADMLKRAGEKAGYLVSHEGSSISPSQYVTFNKAGDEAGNMTRQVRLSNHEDKYPELANGVRTSVDPKTEVSFEQAVNWLGREGFPTSLSKRYKNVPTWEQYYASRPSPTPTPTDERSLKLRALREEWIKNPKGWMPQLEDVK